MRKPIRLADVARAAGVSQGTASNVFNHPNRVRPEVRERVEAVARDLGYGGPDPKGRLLRAGRANAIGLVLAGTLTAGFRDPFDQLFMSGIAQECDARGAGLALISAHDATNEAAAWNIRSALVDGFIVHCLEEGAPLLDLARQRRLPFVAVDIDAAENEMAVRIDDQVAARMETEHLLALGHRRIGILCLELTGEGHFGFVDRARRRALRYAVTRERLAGCADALATVGINLDDVPVMELVLSREKAAAATAAILDRAPDTTAILAMSDVMALGALDFAAARGIKVPEELSVIGFDDVPEAARADPPLTTVAQPIVEKGRRAAELVFRGGPPGIVRLPVELVVRASTAPPREAGRLLPLRGP